MVKKYKMYRLPEEISCIYEGLQKKMQEDIDKYNAITNKKTKITMPMVFKIVASPELNKNYIRVKFEDINNLKRAKKK